jgi:hypothetical protein
MKTKHLLESLAMCCAVVALVGCASAGHQMSESSLDGMIQERDEALSSTGLSQPLIRDEGAFQKLVLDTNTVTLDQWRNFNTNAVAKEELTLDENEYGRINETEFSTKPTKHFELYPVFGDAEIINNHFSWDQQEFEPQGLRLFSIPF